MKIKPLACFAAVVMSMALASCNDSNPEAGSPDTTGTASTTPTTPERSTPTAISTIADTTEPATTTAAPNTTVSPSTAATTIASTAPPTQLGTPDNPEPLTEEGVRAAIADYTERLNTCSAQLTDCNFDNTVGVRSIGSARQRDQIRHDDIAKAGAWARFEYQIRSIEVRPAEERAVVGVCEYGQFLDRPDEPVTLLNRSGITLELVEGSWVNVNYESWTGFQPGDSVPGCDTG